MAGVVNGSTEPACLLCGSYEIQRVLSLTPTPPANALEVLGAESAETPVYPLDLDLCQRCQHLQLSVSVDPKILFENYTYVSPPGMNEHWRRHAAEMIPRFALRADDLVVEIGSNNGDLLKWYKDAGMKVLGFEPATKIADGARARGIETARTFFNARDARGLTDALAGRGLAAKLVLANNVMAHIRDLADVVDGVKTILKDDGVFIFEVQYRGDMLAEGYFDCAYHEHVHYHALGPLVRFFAVHGMVLFDVQRIPTHGGSIRCFVQRLVGVGPITQMTPAVTDMLDEEAAVPWSVRLHNFAERVERARYDFRSIFDSFTWALRNAGGTPKVAVLGAPAKLTTMAYHFGLKADEIAYVCDDAATKIGRATPGTRWVIRPFDHLLDEPPDLAIVAAWNYCDTIIPRVRAMFTDAKRPAPRFLIPFPEPKIV